MVSETKIMLKEEVLVSLLNLTHDAIMIYNLDNKAIYWNVGAERLYGYKAEEMVGKPIYKVLKTRFPLSFEETMDQVKKQGYWEGELQHTTKNGRKLYIDSRWALYRDKNGKVQAVIEINRDISEKKELDRRKDEFLNTASHELKTPLTTIKLYMDLIERELSLGRDRKYLKYVKRVNYQVERMVELVANLLDVTKIQAGRFILNKKLFDIDYLIEEIVEDQQAIDTKQKIIVKGSVGRKVIADQFRVAQILTNLLTNARNYSPKADKIIVHVKVISKEIEIAVQDFGIGIVKEKQALVFKQFFRAEEERALGDRFSSMGLGLYISNQIVKLHGGRMWVKSSLGHGSTFFFTIPVK